MEGVTIQVPVKKKSSAKPEAVLKKLDPETAKVLSTLKDKANKKTFGRKVRDAELIQLGLKLIEPKHLADLQERTLSHQDRLKIAHEEFQKKNGKTSYDDFIGRLLRGEIHLQND